MDIEENIDLYFQPEATNDRFAYIVEQLLERQFVGQVKDLKVTYNGAYLVINYDGNPELKGVINNYVEKLLTE